MSHNRGGRQHPHTDDGKQCRIFALLNGEPIPEPPPPPVWRTRLGETKLHISNLDYSVCDDDLRELFADCGEIVECHVFKDAFSGRSRGFAAVRVIGQDAAEKVLAKHGWIWAGRNLRVKLWERT